jgi:hypothetical protein
MNTSLVHNLIGAHSTLSFDRQDLRLRLVPTNDDSLVRTIRNLLLNVEDSTTSIPLSRPKRVINVSDSAPGNITAVANEVTNAMDEACVGELTENHNSGATTKQWECDSSSSSSCESRSNESSSASRMASKLLKSNCDEDETDGKRFAKRSLDRDSTTVEQSQSMKPRHIPLTDVVMNGDPPEKNPVAKKQAIDCLGDKRVARSSPSVASSSSSSSSSDDDSVSSSSSSSDSNSDTSNSSNSSSSSSDAMST